MADSLAPERRSWNMSRIRGCNTKPEIRVRKLLHQLGYRFTINSRNNRSLPGRPDIVLPKYRAVVFVHGCFWHRHYRCRDATVPKTRVSFWKAKLEGNAKRDRLRQRELGVRDWNVVVVWECQLKDTDRLAAQLSHALGKRRVRPDLLHRGDARYAWT